MHDTPRKSEQQSQSDQQLTNSTPRRCWLLVPSLIALKTSGPQVGNNAADVGQLLPMFQAVKENTGQAPQQLLADAGYRSEKNLEDLADSGVAAVVALGREGKRCAEIDAERSPHTAAMAAKLQSNEGKAAYRRRKWIAEPPNGWIKSVLGFRQFSLRGLHRVQAEFKLVCLALNLRRMGGLKAA